MLNLSYICGFFKDMKEIFYVSLAVGLAIVLIWLMIKYEAARWFMGCIFTFILIAGAVFSCVKLNKYYNTKGGIIGEIKSVFQPNQVDVNSDKTKEITFDFRSVMLTQKDSNLPVYEAEFLMNKYIALDELKNYGVFVNGMPCDVIDYQEDYILADYYYLFEDEEFKPIMEDKLSFRFVFYDTQTRLIVQTSGGINAVKLWNSFFRYNNFQVSVQLNNLAYYQTENIVTLELFEEDKLANIVKLPRGTSYLLPKAEDTKTGYFIGWTDSKGNFYTDKITPITNVKLYATYEDFLNVRFHLNIDEIDTNSNLLSNYLSKKDVSLLLPEKEPTRYGFEFVGWSLDGQNVVNLDNYIVNADITFYAVWQSFLVPVYFEINDSSVVVNDSLFNNGLFKLDCLYDEPIIISNFECENYKLYRFVFSRYDVNTGVYKSVVVLNNNFNVSIYDLIFALNKETMADPVAPDYRFEEVEELKENFSFFVQVQYLRDSEVIEEFSDLEICRSLYALMQYERFDYISANNWLLDYFRDVYYMFYGINDYSKTLLDLASWFVEVAEIDFNVDEFTGTRDFLNMLYVNKDYLVEKNFVSYNVNTIYIGE